MAAETKQWILKSVPMISAPGILKWAINGFRFKKDRPKILNVMKSGWQGPTDETWTGLLTGKIPYTVDDAENVIFEGA